MIIYLLAFLVLITALFLKFVKFPTPNSGQIESTGQSENKYDTVKFARFLGDYSIGLSLILFLMATAMTLLPKQEIQAATVGSIIVIVYSSLGLIYLRTSKQLLKESDRSKSEE